MKVNIDVTVGVTDEQRVQIANIIDGKITRRIATREELRSFIWGEGATWEIALGDQFADAFLNTDPEPEPEPDVAVDELADLL